MNTEKKRCSSCKYMLDKNMFNKDRNKPDGLKCYCKVCQKLRNAEEYQRRKQSRGVG